MPKLHHRKARKDYPDHDIKKGDMYYTWSLMTGPRSSITYRQKNRPRRSQLTSSDFLAQLYDIEDDLEEVKSLDDLRMVIDSLESLESETQEKFDNMPEGLQQGDTGTLLEERVSNIQQAADDLESHYQEWESAEDDDEDFDLDQILDNIKSVSIDV